LYHESILYDCDISRIRCIIGKYAGKNHEKSFGEPERHKHIEFIRKIFWHDLSIKDGLKLKNSKKLLYTGGLPWTKN